MQAVLDYLKQHEARFVQELCDYVRFPSVSAQPQYSADMQACAQWLVTHCKEIGLEAQIHPTSGYPIVVARTRRSPGAARPHFLVYGHYDVQPPEPLELWKTPPFKPTIVGRSLFGRGASDNKGQHFAHMKAVEAYMKTSTPLPCDLTFLVEGEEEGGDGSHLEKFLRQNKDWLRCDGVIISDGGILEKGKPCLTYSLRGITSVDVILTGPSRDLHSGFHGGAVDNPAMVLCEMIAALRNRAGRVAIPGFYDDVVGLTPYERKQMRRLSSPSASYRQFLGVKALFGEKGFTHDEQRTARPTVEINGLTSGYQGEGAKTIIPSWARAKLTFRLVPNQSPSRIQDLVIRQLKKLCPKTVTPKLIRGHGGPPFYLPPKGAKVNAVLKALRNAFGTEPLLTREGGSIPIVGEIAKQLARDIFLIGLALPDDNAHSPNEKFDLDMFSSGMVMSAWLWRDMATF